MGNRVTDAFGHLLVALVEELQGLVELGLDAGLLFVVRGALLQLSQLDHGVAAGLEDLGELVELDDEVETADFGGLQEAAVAADDELFFLEVSGGTGLGGFFFGDDSEEAEGGVDESSLAICHSWDVESPDLGEHGILLGKILHLGFADLGQSIALDGGKGGLDALLELLDAAELLTEGLDFLLEAGEGSLVGNRQHNAGEILAERDELDDRSLRGFGRSGGGFGGGHVRGGVRG